jgi:hypothetical protein
LGYESYAPGTQSYSAVVVSPLTVGFDARLDDTVAIGPYLGVDGSLGSWSHTMGRYPESSTSLAISITAGVRAGFSVF